MSPVAALDPPRPRLTHTPAAGAVAVGLAGLRRRPDHAAELLTQALFGETLAIERRSKDGKWLLVRGADQYAGWVRTWSVATGSSAAVARWRMRATLVVDRAWLWRNDPAGGPLPFGARVAPAGHGYEGPLGPIGLAKEGQGGSGAFRRVRSVRSGSRGRRRPALRRQILETGRRFLGVPYCWGGRSPAGLDCSGFVQLVFGRHELSLPRDARDQCGAVGGVARLLPIERALGPGSRKGPLPGDLWFFGPNRAEVTHVALSTGGLGLLHAYGQVARASLDPAHPTFEPGLFRLILGWAPVRGL